MRFFAILFTCTYKYNSAKLKYFFHKNINAGCWKAIWYWYINSLSSI
ncbi:hypothetical protein [Spiroplasma endosymbiont of Asaphidion curtum]